MVLYKDLNKKNDGIWTLAKSLNEETIPNLTLLCIHSKVCPDWVIATKGRT